MLGRERTRGGKRVLLRAFDIRTTANFRTTAILATKLFAALCDGLEEDRSWASRVPKRSTGAVWPPGLVAGIGEVTRRGSRVSGARGRAKTGLNGRPRRRGRM